MVFRGNKVSIVKKFRDRVPLTTDHCTDDNQDDNLGCKPDDNPEDN
jgi:hypothetical protein